jgi:hypothetical protein
MICLLFVFKRSSSKRLAGSDHRSCESNEIVRKRFAATPPPWWSHARPQGAFGREKIDLEP